MAPVGDGYFEVTIEDAGPGTRYSYRLPGDRDRPDPASRYQPEGVHGPSEVIDPAFDWTDAGWFGLPINQYIIYEVHVGTFTEAGTLDAAIERLDELKALGVTAVELMPVAQFPGARNWGYDGVQLFAVQNSYGGPQALKRFVNACHERGLAAILDVVYNHLGPEGNYLGEFAPYFTDRYKTPWGPALNFDGPDSDHVRRFFLANALYWQTEFHFDALRLDAIHAIRDFSAFPFLEELGVRTRQRADELNRRFYLISESDLNDTCIIRSRDLGGFGHAAQWSDDFHHAVHTLLTGENNGYYRDFGKLEHLIRAIRDGYAYSGQFSVHRRRRHGNPSRSLPAERFVVCIQNHDQVGNRMLGDRLSTLVSLEQLKLGAAVSLLSPYVPLLFMGEEYGETAPFLYFTSHGDHDLIEAVRKGRREEFASFSWQGEAPDPQAEETFRRSKLDFDLKSKEPNAALFRFYQELIRLRKTLPALSRLSKDHLDVGGSEHDKLLWVRRWSDDDQVFLLFHFGSGTLQKAVELPAGAWRKALDSAGVEWRGPGSQFPASLTGGVTDLTIPPWSAVVYQHETGT